MKNIILVLFGLLALGTVAQQSFYDFTVKDIDGNDFSLNQLKGKKVMVVNVASKCAYTKQYKQLQALYEKYSDDGFIIIAFPANNFLWQEPEENKEIKKFCSVNYQVTFPMMSKISVKGKNKHPLYKWLTKEKENGVMDTRVKWNFQKYLIGREGDLERVFHPSIPPNDKGIIEWIEK